MKIFILSILCFISFTFSGKSELEFGSYIIKLPDFDKLIVRKENVKEFYFKISIDTCKAIGGYILEKGNKKFVIDGKETDLKYKNNKYEIKFYYAYIDNAVISALIPAKGKVKEDHLLVFWCYDIDDKEKIFEFLDSIHLE